jgi:catechol 2,3-dioxygenase-like lactoylglutathione lyase family enzyme
MFKVQQIDHVEVFVPDRYEAAKWYEKVFGLTILEDFEFWATEGGPLMISSDGGSTKIALFEGNPPNAGGKFSAKRVAFRVDGLGYLTFLDRLDTIHINNDVGARLTRDAAVDHGAAWSIYFTDPYGNRYEITTYDYDVVKDQS